MANYTQTDFAIVGAGVAGLTLGLQLRKLGYSISVYERSANLFSDTYYTETISAKTLTKLISLIGCSYENFTSTEQKINMLSSNWGSEGVNIQNFISSPSGCSWSICKSKLIKELFKASKDKGIFIYLNTKITDIIFNKDEELWTISFHEKSYKKVRTRWVIDATGRNKAVSKLLGIASVHYDNLIGTYQVFSKHTPQRNHAMDATVLTETTTNGWWFSVLNGNKQRIFIFFTSKSNKKILKKLRTNNGFIEILNQSKYCKALLNYHTDKQLLEKPKGRYANSTLVNEITGTNWVALGDAAASFDPISSQGIEKAIRQSISLSTSFEKGLNPSLKRYELEIKKDFSEYITTRNKIYNKENKWINNQYWDTNL